MIERILSAASLIAGAAAVIYLVHRTSADIRRSEELRKKKEEELKKEHPDEDVHIESWSERMKRVFIEHARDSFKNI